MSMQIFLPFSTADLHLLGRPISVRRLPNVAERFGKVTYGLEDLSSEEIVRDQKDEIGFEILEAAQVARFDGVPLADDERDSVLARVAPPPDRQEG